MMRPDSNKTFTLDDWRRGDPITARHFQQPITALKKLTSGVALPRQRPGVFAGPAAVASAAGAITKQFKITSVNERDFLVCRSLNGAEVGTVDVVVIKPWLLRYTPWNAGSGGATRNGIQFFYSNPQNRRAHRIADAIDENQLVVPRYRTGDILYATRPIVGDMAELNFGLFVDNEQWLDDNRDGRAWAKVYE